ncbi:MAG: serine hydrolase [Planctomycetota bacterium]
MASPESALRALAVGSAIGGLLVLLALWACRRRPRWAAGLAHQVVLLALTSLVLFVPLVWSPSPAVVAGFAIDHGEKFAAPPVAVAGPSFAIAKALLALWLAGVLVLGLRLGGRLWRVVRLERGARPVADPAWLAATDRVQRELRLRRRVRLLRSGDVAGPLAFGLRRPFVVLPAVGDSIPADLDPRLTLLHECAHIARGDTLAQVVADVVCALHWFNPLAWRARRQLEVLQENAADSRVVQAGVRPSDYGAYLLQLFRARVATRGVRPMRLAGVSPMAGEAPLTQRLRCLLARDRNHRALSPTMSRLITSLFALLLASLSVAQAVAVPARGSADDLAAKLAPLFAATMADRHIAGAAISVVQNGELVFANGYGLADGRRKRAVVADETVFRIGSVTKVVTGIAVMHCVDQGLLDLDADVNRYLREFLIPEQGFGPVRVRHLLTHTAGFDQLGIDRHVGTAEAVSPLGAWLKRNLVRIRPVGQVSCYDTYAITLAGYLVEVVSGLSYEDFLKEKIFAPLGMTRSGITVPAALRDDVAVGYEYRGEMVPQRWEFMNTAPASTVNSTVIDMAKLTGMLLGDGAYGGVRVLSAASARAMLTRQFADHPEHPGYGLTLFEDRNHGLPGFSHGGSMTGFGCLMYLLPDEALGVFVACNQESGHLAGAALDAVLETLVGDRLQTPSPPERAEGIDVAPLVGTYVYNCYSHTQPGGWAARPTQVTLDEAGNLRFREATFVPVGERLFVREDGARRMSFLLGEDGEVEHMVVGHNVFERRSGG